MCSCERGLRANHNFQSIRPLLLSMEQQRQKYVPSSYPYPQNQPTSDSGPRPFKSSTLLTCLSERWLVFTKRTYILGYLDRYLLNVQNLKRLYIKKMSPGVILLNYVCFFNVKNGLFWECGPWDPPQGPHSVKYHIWNLESGLLSTNWHAFMFYSKFR